MSSALPICNIAAYRFVAIDDAAALAERVRGHCQMLGLRGSVLVAAEGINLFLAGNAEAIARFLAELESDDRFAGIDVKRSWSRAIPFARLKVKLKAEIISFRDPASVPLGRRAAAITPERLRDWLRRGSDDQGRPLRLLDTRNREETKYGSFAGAESLPIDNFTELPAAVEARRQHWQGSRLVSFCTGGIRCEKAGLWLQQHGFADAVQLDGGILGYFERVGGEGFQGRCFVFDQRLALAPDLSPLVDPDAG